MSAQETISGIAKDICKAANIILMGWPLTAKHLIQLSQIYHHIQDTQDGPISLLMAQMDLETNNNEGIKRYYGEIIEKCDIFCSAYSNHQEEWDKLCSYSSLQDLVLQESKREFGFKIHCANEEKNKWEKIYKKYNYITRIYNSMDCRPGQEEEDLAIIDEYRNELWDLVGHPIELETINEEHDKAKRIKDEKWNTLDELNRNRQQRAGDLLHQIDENIIPDFYDYVLGLRNALDGHLSDIGSNVDVKKRRPGRPKKDEEYESAGVFDFASSFVDTDKYLKVKEVIEEKDHQLSGNEIYYLFEVLQSNNWIKSSLKSVETFADFLIMALGERVKISKGRYVYSGQDNPEYRDIWRDDLKLR